MTAASEDIWGTAVVGGVERITEMQSEVKEQIWGGGGAAARTIFNHLGRPQPILVVPGLISRIQSDSRPLITTPAVTQGLGGERVAVRVGAISRAVGHVPVLGLKVATLSLIGRKRHFNQRRLRRGNLGWSK